MPSRGHETLVEMFRYRPALAPALLADVLGIDVPAHLRARVETGDLADLSPTEYRADALSALAHGAGPDGGTVLDALLGALSAVDQEHSTLYSDIVLAALPEATRHHLEALMASPTYEYQSDFVRRYVFQGRAEGRAEGEAKAVLAFLDARGIPVSDEARTRIAGCTDIEQLDVWVRRAATARSVEDLFG